MTSALPPLFINFYSGAPHLSFAKQSGFDAIFSGLNTVKPLPCLFWTIGSAHSRNIPPLKVVRTALKPFPLGQTFQHETPPSEDLFGMKIILHWRLAATVAMVVGAAFIIALPALSVLRLPPGASFFSAASLALALAVAAVIWLYSLQENHIVAAEKDATSLIKTIPLIFFTVDKQMQLSRLRSTRFDEFFYGKNFGAGTDFASAIGFLTDAQIRQEAGDYVKLMLAQTKSTVSGMNPLECVSALMLNSDGRPELRYFKFAFGDYFETGKFAGILVAINDISDVVNVNAQLQALTQKSDQSAQSSVDLMVRLIKLDRKTLVDKFVSFENLLDEANLELKDSGHSGVRYQTLADQVRKKIKLLKNDAAALGLTELSASAAEMAAELEILGQKPDLSGNDFFSVALKLDVLYDCLHKLSAMLRQLPDAALKTTAQTYTAYETPGTAATAAALETPDTAPAEQATPEGDANRCDSLESGIEEQARVSDAMSTTLNTYASSEKAPLADALPLVNSKLNSKEQTSIAPAGGTNDTHLLRFEFALIQQACIRTAEKLGKKIAVNAQNLIAEAIPDRLKQPLTEILVQLIRSSLANGLELPAVRTAAGKDERATLALTWTELENGGYELVFRDDGYGLNFDVIRSRALALNRISVAQADALDSRQLVGFIFEPGFSTAINPADNAGFGAGLDLVMAAVKRSGGKISVGTQPGLYTQFRVSFPVLKDAS